MLHRVKLLALVLVLSQAPKAQAQFDALVKNVPDGANAVLAIDVEAVLATPMAAREGWGKRLESAFIDRSIFLPPEARRVLQASTLRPDRNFESDNEVALMQLSRSPALAAIARANGGRIEQLKGRDVIVGIADTFVVPVAADVLAAYSPANRQLAGRWIAGLSGNTTLAPFLQKAVGSVSKDRPIVLALDLADVISASDAAQKLKASKILDGASSKSESVAAQLATLQGIAVDVAIGSDARATLRVEFGKPVELSAELMKRIVVKALDENGLKLDEFDKANFKVSGNTVTANAELTTGGLRRIMSLLAPPELAVESAETPSKPSSGDTLAASSQAYFKTVVSLLDDLRGDRAKQDPRGGMDAVWMDKYAQKIDRMSVLNVDQDVVEWGTKTAQTLRVMSTSRRGAGLSAGSQKSALRTGFTGSYYYGGSYSSATATANDSNQIDVQTGNVATANRVEGWRLIDNATAELRKKETQRYGIDF